MISTVTPDDTLTQKLLAWFRSVRTTPMAQLPRLYLNSGLSPLVVTCSGISRPYRSLWLRSSSANKSASTTVVTWRHSNFEFFQPERVNLRRWWFQQTRRKKKKKRLYLVDVVLWWLWSNYRWQVATGDTGNASWQILSSQSWFKWQVWRDPKWMTFLERRKADAVQWC